MGLIVTDATVEQVIHISKLFWEFDNQWKFDYDISAEFWERAYTGFRGKWDLSHWTCAPQTVLKGNLTLRGRTTVRGS